MVLISMYTMAGQSTPGAILIMRQGFQLKNIELVQFMTSTSLSSQTGTEALKIYRYVTKGIQPCRIAGSIEAQFREHQTGGRGNTFTGTTAFEGRARVGGDENSSAMWRDVRTLSKAGRMKEALDILNQRRISAESETYVCLLQECIKVKDIAGGKQVHSHIIQSRFKPNIFVCNTLISMYAKCGSIVDARQVFEKMPERNLFTWTIMIAGYAKHGYGWEALETYQQMQQEGVAPNKVTFICILNACASLGVIQKAKEVHTDIINAGIRPDIVLETALADMYAKCSSVKDARQVFDNMAARNVVSWNVMIGGYARHGCLLEAFEIYKQMQQEGVKPDRVTFICVLNACANPAALQQGKEVHGDIMEAQIGRDVILETALVDMYAKCGNLKDARQVFDNMAKRNVVSWSAMIAGYSQNGCGREAFELYEQMIQEGVKPDRVSFISVLNACASLGSLEKGKEVHTHIMKAGIVPDVILQNSLVYMYAKSGSVKDARKMFENMAQQDVVSWNTMIAGYAQHRRGREVFELYKQMQHEGVMPDRVTFISVLNACASLAALEQGKEVHADIISIGIESHINLENTLVNMYAKCGSLEDAWEVFDKMAERDVVSWNAMIAGYCQHGYGREALQLFKQMQQGGLKPDGITFTSLLSACSHVGLVDEGRHFFDSMTQDHGLTPTVEHFGCMVDLLGRAGHLDEAEDFVDNMPIEPDASVWGALLGACRIHCNVGLAERAAKCLLKLDPQDAGTYVLLSNIYASAGKWDETAKVRKMMKDRGVRKEPGSAALMLTTRCTHLL